MVDFNNDATIGTPAVNIVKILLLQARANVLESFEFYNKKISQGIEADQSHLKARILTWFLEHQSYLKRTLKKEQYKEILEKMKKDFLFNEKELSKEKFLDMVMELNNIMDNLRLTRVDLKKQYDKSDIEEDNKQNELS